MDIYDKIKIKVITCLQDIEELRKVKRNII